MCFIIFINLFIGSTFDLLFFPAASVFCILIYITNFIICFLLLFSYC